MGMKNPLHRKKLQLALRAFTTKVIEKSSELDYIWVTRKTPLYVQCLELLLHWSSYATK